MTLTFKVFRGGKTGSRLFCKVALAKEPNIKEVKTQPHEFFKIREQCKHNHLCFVLIQYSLGSNLEPGEAGNAEEREGGCAMHPWKQESSASKTNSTSWPSADNTESTG